MTISAPADRIELAELSKLIIERKTAHMRKYYMERIGYVVNIAGSLKAAKRRLGVVKNQTYAPKDKQGNVITNRDEVVTAAEQFYRDLYIRLDIKDNAKRESSSGEIDLPPVTTGDVRKVFKERKGGKVTGEDEITADILKDFGEIVLEKLLNLYTQ